MRHYNTGAVRDSDDGKLDYAGFLSSAVLKRYAEYLHQHRKCADGSMRGSDNWKKGIPKDDYMRSAFRHFMEWWQSHEQGQPDEDAICGVLFNAMGYLFELRMGDTQVREAPEAPRDVWVAPSFPTEALLP